MGKTKWHFPKKVTCKNKANVTWVWWIDHYLSDYLQMHWGRSGHMYAIDCRQFAISTTATPHGTPTKIEEIYLKVSHTRITFNVFSSFFPSTLVGVALQLPLCKSQTVYCRNPWCWLHSKIFLLTIVLQVTNHTGFQDTWSTIKLT